MMHSRYIILIAVSLAVLTVKAQPSFTADTTVTYISQDSITLAATLTMPTGMKKKVPAVVIMSGTGKQDRDGSMAGHKLFRDIAEYLSSHGIAVLRSDDRGVGKSTGDYSFATTADFAEDAIAAVRYLKTIRGIDSKKVGLIGHSEGGASISIAASKCKDISFIISLAGLMTDGLSSVIQQNKDIVASSPLPVEDKPRYDEINDIMFHTAYEYAESDTLDSVLWHRYDEWKVKDAERWKATHSDEEFDRFRFSIYMYAMTATSPWYRFFIRYNPADYLCKVTIPVLAINGEKDIMVNCQQNLGNVNRYLAHNKDVTTLSYPNINHLLLPCLRGTQDEYPTIKEDVPSYILKDIVSWIKKRF